MKATLYLVPTPLDHGCQQLTPLADVLPQGAIAIAARLTHWICENAKSCRAFLKRVDATQPLAAPVQAQKIHELPRAAHKKGDHGSFNFDPQPLIAAAQARHDVGLISEAGMPAVADPGSSVVRAAHELGMAVVPLVGPASILLALAASGLNGQNFAFTGYLPQEAAARSARIRELEALAQKTGQTQLFIETPYRNAALWQALLQTLGPQTHLAVHSGLTLAAQHSRMASVADWRAIPQQAAWRQALALPTLFAIGK
ncbi:MAG: SAM-dependent methyltransferase [Burkholderiaceae bacterium]|jgi:16S rRNA (cytidine1402-2'-O)-methyltransferase|nr:SAM-dependent methyltransferase [Burkholderiaceae bacterium]